VVFPRFVLRSAVDRTVFIKIQLLLPSVGELIKENEKQKNGLIAGLRDSQA